MSIINQIESLINEIESLLKKQNLELNENTEINDLIKTKRELIRRIESEFLESEEGIKRVISYLNLRQNRNILNFLEYLQRQLSYLKDLIEKELVLDKSGEIEREIEILHFELKTILGIKDNEYFKNLVGLHTRVSQNEGKVLKQHKNLISEEIKILTSTFSFSKEYREKLKEVFSTNKGIFLLRLLKENCENDKTYKDILGYGFAYGILQNPKIKQLEVNELLEVIKEFVNLRKDCEGDKTYEDILYYGFAYGILQNPKIQQLEVNELLEVITEFVNLRKDCEGDETYKSILCYGFANGILQNPKIQQLEVNELLEVIREFGKTLIRVVDDLHKRENVLSLFTYLINPVIINTSSSDFDKDKETILKNIEKNLTILLSEINNSKNYSNFYDIKYLFKNKIYCFHSVNAYFGGMTGNRTLKKSPLENLKKCLTNSVNFTPSCSIFREGKEFTIVGSFGIILNFGYIYKSYISDGRTIEEGNYENKNVNVYRINKGEYDSFLKERERARKNKEKIKISNIINNQFSPYLILKYCSNLKNEVIVRNWTPFAIFYIKGEFNELDKLKEISNELSFKKYRNGEKFYRKFKIWNSKDDFIEKVFPIYEVDQEKGTLKKVYEPIKK